MPVGEMLRRMSARELSEWKAYEQTNGLLGDRWEQEMLREIHYQQQLSLHTLVGMKLKQGAANPIPEPKRVPAPNEFMVPPDEDGEE